ncbi:hypothetical protein KSS87_007147 [Heliosperma pusillum]|nr:hypothetical protein KSS87_007147 [Heliosperma pusillum]
MASFASLKSQVFDREDRKQHYQAHIRGLNAFERHHKFLNDYVNYYGKEKSLGEIRPLKTDQDTLREGYRFIRTEDDEMDTSWEQRLVKRYYDKLFKEYCIADMSKYKTGKIGLRWRTEKEVMSGKGQFICGNKHCDEREGLASFEASILCAEKLHYKRNKEQAEIRQKEEDNRTFNCSLSVLGRELTGIEDDMGDEHRKSFDRKRTESEMEREDSRGRRKRSSSKDTSDIEAERSKVRKKKDLIHVFNLAEKRESRAGKGSEDEDEDSYDEYLEGMFP